MPVLFEIEIISKFFGIFNRARAYQLELKSLFKVKKKLCSTFFLQTKVDTRCSILQPQVFLWHASPPVCHYLPTLQELYRRFHRLCFQESWQETLWSTQGSRQSFVTWLEMATILALSSFRCAWFQLSNGLVRTTRSGHLEDNCPPSWTTFLSRDTQDGGRGENKVRHVFK